MLCQQKTAGNLPVPILRQVAASPCAAEKTVLCGLAGGGVNKPDQFCFIYLTQMK